MVICTSLKKSISRTPLDENKCRHLREKASDVGNRGSSLTKESKHKTRTSQYHNAIISRFY